MQDSGESRDPRTPVTGLKEIGQESAEIPLNAAGALESAPDSATPPPRIQPVSERFPALEKQEIILTFSAPEAKEVTVAGDFNGWNPDAAPLEKTGDGEWALRLMLRSGQYEYRFVVDGRWYEDPQASGRAACPFGGFNSVLMVPLAVRTSIL